MRRIVVCLLIALASASVAARESKLSDAEGGSCRGAQSTTTRAPDRDGAVLPAPVKKAKPVMPNTGGGGDDVRLQSPRWHRFLPGMFR
jgi:hypothetical protein